MSTLPVNRVDSLPADALPPGGGLASPTPVRWGDGALVGLFAIALIGLLKAASAVLVPISAALVLTFVFAPVVRRLRRHGIHEAAGAGIVVVALIATTLLAFSSLAGPATQWWERAPTTLAQLMDRFDHLRIGSRNEGQRETGGPIPPARSGAASATPPQALPSDSIKEQLATEGVALTRVVIGRLLFFCVSAAATVILLYFLLASEHWVVSRSVEAIPRRRSRALFLGGLRSVQREISHFLSSLALVNFGVGLAMIVATWWLGLPNPVLWGTVSGALNFIPYLGPIIASALLLMAGIVTFDTLPAMMAPAAALLIVHGIESNFISPFFVGKRLSLSPVSMCLSVMCWGWLWGMAGAVMAVPILVAARAVCKRRRSLRLWHVYMEGSVRPASSLRALLRGKHRAETQRLA
ncbi:AI-2E family transporter [Ideonella sp. DXS29W]|uniref:AI-2E family transporter n=1 Tax=Ideonella lacteola TaxID=2984193 RepID=A0ABU9BI01_9BURK